MKKSTILLLVVVYILSFFLIGLLGHSLRTYNDPEVYPESIELLDPDNKTELTLDVKDPDTGELLYNYYFLFRNYEPSMSVRIKAVVKPDNCTYPEVDFVKDADNTSFNLLTHKTNPEIEEGFCEITLNESLEPFVPLSAPFTVKSKNPGIKINVEACVTFVSTF